MSPLSSILARLGIIAWSSLVVGACDAPGDGRHLFVPAACENGVLDADEADVDCGGPCTPCAVGRACEADADCAAGNCAAGLCGEPARCDDGLHNGDESDVDCGGGVCEGCRAAAACHQDRDCLSGRCADGVCAAPASCDNGMRDGDESDIDCGGACAACATTRFCRGDGDCLSRVCMNGICRDESCDDGRRNQDESGVDCGGRCAPCDDGGPCVGDDDCATGRCERGACCEPNACGQCAALPAETCDGLDNDCDGQTDELAAIGPAPACPKGAGICQGARATCRGAAGWTCDESDYRKMSAAYEAEELSCDGIDNDCDGLTDEGLRHACGGCGPAPSEVCDGVDNDCDGLTDEGLVNACGTCGPAPAERCDGIDNDCDGQTDELAVCDTCDFGPPVTLGVSDPALWYVPVPQALAVTSSQRVAALAQWLRADEFDLVLLEPGYPNLYTGRGYAYALAPLGDDLLVAHRGDGIEVTRVRVDGSVAATWRNVIALSQSVLQPHLASDGIVAALSVSRFDQSTTNPYRIWEALLESGTWHLRDVASASSRSLVALAGGRAVHVYTVRRSSSDGAPDDVWSLSVGSEPQRVATETGPPADVLVDGEGRLHVALDLPGRIATRATDGAWRAPWETHRWTIEGLASLPTGELITVFVGATDLVVYALDPEGDREIARYPLPVPHTFAQPRFVVDAYARIHVMLQSFSPATIATFIVCPAP